MTKYNIHNPCTAHRVIYNGLAGADLKKIGIRPGQTIEGVELSDDIAEELMIRHEKDPRNELKLDVYVEPPPAEEQEEGSVVPAMKMTVNEDKIEVLKAPSAKKGRG